MKFQLQSSIDPGSEFKKSYRTILNVVALPVAILGIVLLWASQHDVLLSDLTRDPNTVAKVPAYIGLISNMGIFFWSAAATVCFFSALLLRDKWSKEEFRFLALGGVLSFMLGIDDAFQIHEKFMNTFFKIHVHEMFFYSIYGITCLALMILGINVILKSGYLLWVAALGFFFCSVLYDKELISVGQNRAFYEDSFKFVGIVCWAFYFLLTCTELIKIKFQSNSYRQYAEKR